MNGMKFEALKETAVDQLKRRIKSLRALSAPKFKIFHIRHTHFSSEDVRDRFLEEVGQWIGADTNIIYLIDAQKIDAKTMESIRRLFGKDQKAKLPERKYSQWNNRDGRCLYVGSSQKMRRRLKEHLGFGTEHTYALNLVHWASELDLALSVRILKFPKEIDYQLIQHLEDVVWEMEKPLFGRQGRR